MTKLGKYGSNITFVYLAPIEYNRAILNRVGKFLKKENFTAPVGIKPVQFLIKVERSTLFQVLISDCLANFIELNE